MNSDKNDYRATRRLHFNPGAEARSERLATSQSRLGLVRIEPWPAPVALGEPQHNGEKLVYDSFLRDSPGFVGFAAYSMPLPLSPTRRLEVDFVAMTPHGVALIEVKGGLVRVDSRPGPSVRWEHYTRAGKPTGGYVTPAQIYRATEVFDLAAQAMTGVSFGGRFAQILVFPHTSRNILDLRLLDTIYGRDRDFARIVFAEDLIQHGMWALVEDELSMPGRSRPLNGSDVDQLWSWVLSELDVRSGPAQHASPAADVQHIQCLTPFMANYNKAPTYSNPLDAGSSHPPNGWHPTPQKAEPSAVPREPRAGRWRKWLLAGLAIFGAFVLLREPSAPKFAPNEPTPPASTLPPASKPTVATPIPSPAPRRPAPTQDPFQNALTRAVAEPEKRIAVDGENWVRALGAISGRPDCQLVEMSRSGKVSNVVACSEVERGAWRY
jgi:hypothetical protein